MSGLVRLARALKICQVGRVDSTQDLAHQAAEKGAPTGTVFIAAEQTGGRGSRGRSWESAAGGLWLSVVVRPAAAAVPLLSVRAGLAIAESLATVPRLPQIMVKWPNDLIVADRKAGGILVEARWRGDDLDWAVVGVGLNVHNRVPDGAAALDPERRVALAALAPIVARAIVAAAERPSAVLDELELNRFAKRDWLLGRILDRPAAGWCRGIDQEGRLLVEEAPGALIATRNPIGWTDLAGPGPPS